VPGVGIVLRAGREQAGDTIHKMPRRLDGGGGPGWCHARRGAGLVIRCCLEIIGAPQKRAKLRIDLRLFSGEAREFGLNPPAWVFAELPRRSNIRAWAA
jgi:hypothetical protein